MITQKGLKQESEPRVAIAHLGSRWNYDLPVILQDLGMLTQFYTDSYCGNGSWLKLVRYLPAQFAIRAIQRLQSRYRNELLADKVTAFNLLGIEFNSRYRKNQTHTNRLQLFVEINCKFNQLICAQNLPPETNIFFSMNTASLELFESLKNTTVKLLMDQNLLPMQVEQSILDKEYARWGDWTIGSNLNSPNSPIFQEWVKREEKEWELADLILCASARNAAALQSCNVPTNKCKVIPYPVNPTIYRVDRSERQKSPLRILFAGQVNLRKGIPYFLNMLKQLPAGSFEARVVGSIQVNSDIVSQYSDYCTFTGIVPRTQMPQHYAWADVFVFPSLCDSAPGTTNEALAAGLPVVTTEGAGTIVENGIDGWIVPDRDVEALAACIEYLDRDRTLLTQMSFNAVKKASTINLSSYGKQLRDVCQFLLSSIN